MFFIYTIFLYLIDQATLTPVWIVIPIFIVLILVAVVVIICIIGCIVFVKSRRFRRRFKTFSEEMDSVRLYINY